MRKWEKLHCVWTVPLRISSTAWDHTDGVISYPSLYQPFCIEIFNSCISLSGHMHITQLSHYTLYALGVNWELMPFHRYPLVDLFCAGLLLYIAVLCWASDKTESPRSLYSTWVSMPEGDSCPKVPFTVCVHSMRVGFYLSRLHTWWKGRVKYRGQVRYRMRP